MASFSNYKKKALARALILTVALAAGCAVSHAPKAMADDSLSLSSVKSAKLPLEGKVIDVGLSIAPPFVIVDGDFTNLSGIDVDIIRELQKRTSFKASHNRFNVMNFNELFALANEGKVGIVGGGISLTAERARRFILAGPTYNSQSVVVVKDSNNNITKLEDLAGRTVAAEAGVDVVDLFPAGEQVSVRLKNKSTNFMALYSVSRGDADAMITDAPIAFEYVQGWEDGNLKVAFPIENSDTPMGLLFSKNKPESAVLYQAYMQMVRDGTVHNIVTKYLGEATVEASLEKLELEEEQEQQALASDDYDLNDQYYDSEVKTSAVHEQVNAFDEYQADES